MQQGDPELRDALNCVVEKAGGRCEIERRLKRSRGFVRRVIEGPRQSYPQILEILKAAHVPPGNFFREIHPAVEPPDPLIEGLAIGKDPDPQLSDLLRRLAKEASKADVTKVKGPFSEADEAAALEAARCLDNQRYTDPPVAAAEARQLVDQVAELQIHPLRRAVIAGKVAGVLGSAYRTAYRLREAGWVLRETFNHLDDLKAHKERAEVLERIGMLLACRGRYSDCLRVSGQAMRFYAEELGDSVSVAKCSIQQGNYHYLANCREAALSAFEVGLGLLPVERDRHRASALNGLALICHQKGQAKTAATYLDEADACGLTEPYSRALLIRVRGDMVRSQGHLTAAARHYCKARDLLLKINPVDATLAGIDAAASLTDLGRNQEAVQDLGRLLAPLHKVSPTAEDHLLELVLHLARGEEISHQMLENTRRKITAAFSLKA